VNSLLTVTHVPETMSMAKLFKKAFDGVDLKPLRAQTLQRAQLDPSDAAARMDLCVIDQLLGEQAAGLKWQEEALGLRRIYRSSWPASPDALRVLAFLAPGDIGTNAPIDFLLQDLDVVLYSLYMIPGQPLPDALPDHDVAIVTADDSDLNHAILRDIGSLLSMWPCAVLNRPDRVARLSREIMYSFLQSVRGLAMPPTVRITRTSLEKIALDAAMLRDISPDMRFPLIIRPVDSHAGRGLAKVGGSSSISTYLAGRKEAEFVISPFIDYRSSDGLFRKYRIIWVDGRSYPCHMGIADDWKVWYYNAGMAASAAKRAEEAEFMTNFHDGFARRHAGALDAIVNEFGLEYMGIDCAETPDGRLLVFEGSISLVAHDMDSPSLYPYKSPQMQKLFASFCEMLKRKSMIGLVCVGEET
jgi:glutathione synthase/RimK-type ligase-like ATP-grasp enzyme